MGVTGLWKLIEQSGKPVPLETLENKVLAIDISIWLHQVVKGFQDASGAALPHAHLLGLFHRLCKLLYYRIKPVFVFDGGVPYLKRETMRKRTQNKRNFRSEADRLQQLLLESMAREKIVQQALGEAGAKMLSPQKRDKPTFNSSKDDLYKLPPLNENSEFRDKSSTSIDTEEDSSFDEKNSKQYYNVNIQSIDVTSKHFKGLPADVRHDILTDLKEMRKESSWGRLHELPAQSDDFSEFQMKRLLKRRQVQVSLEDAEKEMGGTSLSLAEIENLLKEEGVVDIDEAASKSSGKTTISKHIASDENTRYLHVRDVKKAMKQEEDDKPSPPKKPKLKDDPDTANDDPDTIDLLDEEEQDLQRAIQMSLAECCEPHTTETTIPDDRVKLRPEQKRILGNAAKTLAKAYMVEYGGMNAEDIEELMEMPDEDAIGESSFKYNDVSVLHRTADEVQKPNPTDDDNDDVSSNADSDFIDVPEFDADSDCSLTLRNVPDLRTNISPPPDPTTDFRHSDLEIPISKKDNCIEVVIKPDATLNDDLFADIFMGRNIDENLKIEVATHDKSIKGAESSSSIPTKLESDLKKVKHQMSGIEKIELINLDTKILPKVELVSSTSENDAHGSSKINNIKPKITLVSNDFMVSIPKSQSVLKKSESSDILKELSLKMSEIEKITLDDLDDQPKLVSPPTNIKPILKSKNDLNNILSNLNSEMESLADITLDAVILAPASSKEVISPKRITENIVKEDNDIIEINDDTDEEKNTTVQTPKKTKQSKISTFIEIKVTPTKSNTPEKKSCESPVTPKIASPFFRKKTPSSKKRSPADDVSSIDHSKVSKSLFPETDNLIPGTSKENSVPSTALTADDVIDVAASILRDQKSKDELSEMATSSKQTTRDLAVERNKQDRLGMSITESMSADCKRLLRLFGVPYVVAPMEAEAQCAFLDATNVTDGTITDDSDIWLFGGTTVYKHFFNQQKNVVEFRSHTVEQLFNVERSKLIQMAMLVGSDYTTGVNGIGAVTALEILATFPQTPEMQGETNESMSMLSSLRKFKEWWVNGQKIGPKNALRNKLKNITLSDEFPRPDVIDAYLHPIVNKTVETLSWGYPDAETIREFAKNTFGWTYSKTDDTLLPVLKKLDEKKLQSSIRNYFNSTGVISNKEVTVSKRVRQAINKMSKDYVHDNNDDGQPAAQKPRKPRAKKVVKSTDDADESNKTNEKKPRKPRKIKTGAVEKFADNSVASTSKNCEVPVTHAKRKKTGHVPDFSPPITQREKDKEDLDKNKLKAIELFKRTRSLSLKKGKK